MYVCAINEDEDEAEVTTEESDISKLDKNDLEKEDREESVERLCTEVDIVVPELVECVVDKIDESKMSIALAVEDLVER